MIFRIIMTCMLLVQTAKCNYLTDAFDGWREKLGNKAVGNSMAEENKIAEDIYTALSTGVAGPFNGFGDRDATEKETKSIIKAIIMRSIFMYKANDIWSPNYSTANYAIQEKIYYAPGGYSESESIENKLKKDLTREIRSTVEDLNKDYSNEKISQRQIDIKIHNAICKTYTVFARQMWLTYTGFYNGKDILSRKPLENTVEELNEFFVSETKKYAEKHSSVEYIDPNDYMYLNQLPELFMKVIEENRGILLDNEGNMPYIEKNFIKLKFMKDSSIFNEFKKFSSSNDFAREKKNKILLGILETKAESNQNKKKTALNNALNKLKKYNVCGQNAYTFLDRHFGIINRQESAKKFSEHIILQIIYKLSKYKQEDCQALVAFMNKLNDKDKKILDGSNIVFIFNNPVVLNKFIPSIKNKKLGDKSIYSLINELYEFNVSDTIKLARWNRLDQITKAVNEYTEDDFSKLRSFYEIVKEKKLGILDFMRIFVDIRGIDAELISTLAVKYDEYKSLNPLDILKVLSVLNHLPKPLRGELLSVDVLKTKIFSGGLTGSELSVRLGKGFLTDEEITEALADANSKLSIKKKDESALYIELYQELINNAIWKKEIESIIGALEENDRYKLAKLYHFITGEASYDYYQEIYNIKTPVTRKSLEKFKKIVKVLAMHKKDLSSEKFSDYLSLIEKFIMNAGEDKTKDSFNENTLNGLYKIITDFYHENVHKETNSSYLTSMIYSNHYYEPQFVHTVCLIFKYLKPLSKHSIIHGVSKLNSIAMRIYKGKLGYDEIDKLVTKKADSIKSLAKTLDVATIVNDRQNTNEVILGDHGPKRSEDKKQADKKDIVINNLKKTKIDGQSAYTAFNDLFNLQADETQDLASLWTLYTEAETYDGKKLSKLKKFMENIGYAERDDASLAGFAKIVRNIKPIREGIIDLLKDKYKRKKLTKAESEMSVWLKISFAPEPLWGEMIDLYNFSALELEDKTASQLNSMLGKRFLKDSEIQSALDNALADPTSDLSKIKKGELDPNFGAYIGIINKAIFDKLIAARPRFSNPEELNTLAYLYHMVTSNYAFYYDSSTAGTIEPVKEDSLLKFIDIIEVMVEHKQKLRSKRFSKYLLLTKKFIELQSYRTNASRLNKNTLDGIYLLASTFYSEGTMERPNFKSLANTPPSNFSDTSFKHMVYLQYKHINPRKTLDSHDMDNISNAAKKIEMRGLSNEDVDTICEVLAESPGRTSVQKLTKVFAELPYFYTDEQKELGLAEVKKLAKGSGVEEVLDALSKVVPELSPDDYLRETQGDSGD